MTNVKVTIEPLYDMITPNIETKIDGTPTYSIKLLAIAEKIQVFTGLQQLFYT